VTYRQKRDPGDAPNPIEYSGESTAALGFDGQKKTDSKPATRDEKGKTSSEKKESVSKDPTAPKN